MAFPPLRKQADGDFDITRSMTGTWSLSAFPEESLRKFVKYEEARVDQALCHMNFGYPPQEAVLESITLLGDHAIPELKAMGARRSAEGLERAITLHESAE